MHHTTYILSIVLHISSHFKLHCISTSETDICKIVHLILFHQFVCTADLYILTISISKVLFWPKNVKKNICCKTNINHVNSSGRAEENLLLFFCQISAIYSTMKCSIECTCTTFQVKTKTICYNIFKGLDAERIQYGLQI